ncbi:MAG: hypothetical protein R2727_01785 [Bacteroidales bacterium]
MAKAKKTTTSLLDSLGIGYAGLTSKPYHIIARDSILIGFVPLPRTRGQLILTTILLRRKSLNSLTIHAIL